MLTLGSSSDQSAFSFEVDLHRGPRKKVEKYKTSEDFIEDKV
jgi:hypothetical protein